MRGLTAGGEAEILAINGTKTFMERLQREKNDLEERLKTINSVVKLLEANPSVLDVIEALHKLGY